MKSLKKFKEFKNFLLNEAVAWTYELLSLIEGKKIPLSPSIINLLYEDKIIDAFHISDTDNITNLSKIIGKRNTISSFLYYNESRIKKLAGVQTKGGIIYNLEGKLVFNSNSDIMSENDKSLNRRWISADTLSQDVYKDLIEFIKDNSRAEKNLNYIKAYLNAVKTSIIKHKNKIKNRIINHIINTEYGDWNEILVKNIKIKEILYKPKENDDEEVITEDLKKICNNVVVEYNEENILKWFVDHGGIIDNKELIKSNINKYLDLSNLDDYNGDDIKNLILNKKDVNLMEKIFSSKNIFSKLNNNNILKLVIGFKTDNNDNDNDNKKYYDKYINIILDNFSSVLESDVLYRIVVYDNNFLNKIIKDEHYYTILLEKIESLCGIITFEEKEKLFIKIISDKIYKKVSDVKQLMMFLLKRSDRGVYFSIVNNILEDEFFFNKYYTIIIYYILSNPHKMAEIFFIDIFKKILNKKDYFFKILFPDIRLSNINANLNKDTSNFLCNYIVNNMDKYNLDFYLKDRSASNNILYYTSSKECKNFIEYIVKDKVPNYDTFVDKHSIEDAMKKHNFSSSYSKSVLKKLFQND